LAIGKTWGQRRSGHQDQRQVRQDGKDAKKKIDRRSTANTAASTVKLERDVTD
jgi:hypothetical protein